MKQTTLTILFFIFLFTINGFAQQLAHHSQYMFNDLFINPAIAGTKDNHPLMGTIRNQWLGLDDAPQTSEDDVEKGSKDESGTETADDKTKK